MAQERTAHWGTCDNEDCLTALIIYPHPEAQQDLPAQDKWEQSTFYIDCPVCGHQMQWGGTDPAADVVKGYYTRAA